MPTARSMFALFLTATLATITSAAPTSFTNGSSYVLVGGGPAGFVLAEYLSRNSAVTVTLLEAGPDEDSNPYITTPAEFLYATGYTWPYLSQPDPNLLDGTPDLAQGKLFGGGSAVNAMLYCRGAASVYDEWADLSGNEGLRWESLLDSFVATTHYAAQPKANNQHPVNASSFGDGPLEISRYRQLFALDEPLLDKFASNLSLPEVDFVSGAGIGVSVGLESIRESNRTRSYAYNAFGYLANGRPNFHLISDAWVSRIGIQNKTATSVTYNDTATNTMHTLQAGEIVITAGAINSAQLLLLSGIGPADQLEALGIHVVQDSPQVGQDLSDHHLAVLEYTTIPEQESVWQWTENATDIAIETADYAKNGSGVLGTNNGGLFAAVRLPDSVFEGVGDFYPNLPADRPHVLYEYTSAALLPGPNVSAITAWVALVQPESRGNVTLASADYRDAPLINSNYYGTPAEKAAMLYAYKQLRGILTSEEVQPYIPTELYPGVNVTSDDALWHAIQQGSGSFHHPVGTTAIGTVLDANWRVKGVKGLRVVGASAEPVVPTCPIQAAAYAVAHRAALDIVAADGI